MSVWIINIFIVYIFSSKCLWIFDMINKMYVLFKQKDCSWKQKKYEVTRYCFPVVIINVDNFKWGNVILRGVFLGKYWTNHIAIWKSHAYLFDAYIPHKIHSVMVVLFIVLRNGVRFFQGRYELKLSYRSENRQAPRYYNFFSLCGDDLTYRY